MDESALLARFQAAFADLRPGQEMGLAQVYAPAIVFDDPLHHIEGLPALERYFAELNARLVSGALSFGAPIVAPGAAFLPWTMRLQLRGARRLVTATGASHVRYGALITHQRDYFDAGELIYEQVPLIGAIVRQIKAAAQRATVRAARRP